MLLNYDLTLSRALNDFLEFAFVAGRMNSSWNKLDTFGSSTP